MNYNIHRDFLQDPTQRCRDFADCSECTARHCPNLAPLDPDDCESLSGRFVMEMDGEIGTEVEEMEEGY